MLEFSRVIYMDESKKPHNRIAELRKEKKLTLQQVADTVGVGNNTISRYETGKRKPSEKALTKISNLFRVPVTYLQGNGWSQDDVIWFLIYVYINEFNEDLELPSGVHSYRGTIEKYGIEKETLEDFDDKDIPGFVNKVEEFLIDYKRDDIVHDLILDYYDGDEGVAVDDSEIQNYVDDEFHSLVEKYLSDNDLNTIREEALDELKNNSIDLPSVLERLISEELLKPLDFFRLDHKEIPENDDVNIAYLKLHINNSFFKKFKDEATNKIKSLNDYVFLSSIGEDFTSTGICPEYEISEKLYDDLKLKDFKAREEYFSHDPYKASKEAISNLSMSNSDKSSLIDIVNYLLNENEELKDRIDELSDQINNSDCFNEDSNNDYRGYR